MYGACDPIWDFIEKGPVDEYPTLYSGKHHIDGDARSSNLCAGTYIQLCALVSFVPVFILILFPGFFCIGLGQLCLYYFASIWRTTLLPFGEL